MKLGWSLCGVVLCLLAAQAIADQGDLILNEWNAVSADSYLAGGSYKVDTTKEDPHWATIPGLPDGRIEGNGGNWIELVVIQDHLDIRGWQLRLPVMAPPYEITLVQKPGVDFYESYFEIARSDGKIAELWIDGDDSRWWNPDVIYKNGKIYFVRSRGRIDEYTSYVDPENDIIFSGYGKMTYKISELDFK